MTTPIYTFHTEYMSLHNLIPMDLYGKAHTYKPGQSIVDGGAVINLHVPYHYPDLCEIIGIPVGTLHTGNETDIGFTDRQIKETECTIYSDKLGIKFNIVYSSGIWCDFHQHFPQFIIKKNEICGKYMNEHGVSISRSIPIIHSNYEIPDIAVYHNPHDFKVIRHFYSVSK